MTKLIGLTKEKFVLVDDDDYPVLNQWKWSYLSAGYACRGEDGKMILMHRFILRAEEGVFVDHANRRKWDNRRCNLRIATPQQSTWNTTKINRNGYRGVTFHTGRPKPYQAAIRRDGRKKSLGYYVTAEEAARAYDAAATMQYGEYAKLNFPEIAADPVDALLIAEMQRQLREMQTETERRDDEREGIDCWQCQQDRPRNFDDCPNCGADVVWFP